MSTLWGWPWALARTERRCTEVFSTLRVTVGVQDGH